MVSSDPPPDSVDSGWDEEIDIDLDEDEEEGATAEKASAPARVGDSQELFARAMQSIKETANHPAARDQSEVRPSSDLRATLPPPMPAAQYVEEMMRTAPESDASPLPRPRLETLHEIDPLQFDLIDTSTPVHLEFAETNVPMGEDDETLAGMEREEHHAAETLPPPTKNGPPPQELIDLVAELDFPFDDPPSGSRERASDAGPVSLGSPSIETAEEYLDDPDPQIARNTPPIEPPALADFDVLDELPVDEVLLAVSRRPTDLVPPPPLKPIHPSPIPPPAAPAVPAGLRLGTKSEAPVARPRTPLSVAPLTREEVPSDSGVEAELIEVIEDQDVRATLPGEPTSEMLAAAAARSVESSSELADTFDHGEGFPVPPLATPDPIEEVFELFEAGSYNTALDMAEAILAEHPDHEAAKQCVENCQHLLLQTYLTRLGDPTSVLRVTIDPGEVTQLGLDHRAGFLLSFIDGVMSLEEVLDVSSMPAFDAARILCELKSRGVIVVDPPASKR